VQAEVQAHRDVHPGVDHVDDHGAPDRDVVDDDEGHDHDDEHDDLDRPDHGDAVHDDDHVHGHARWSRRLRHPRGLHAHHPHR
jgi:hypothetical protein